MGHVDRLKQALLRLFLLGAAATAVQALLARSFLAAFGGNEAVLAALFGVWLVAGAVGAALGRARATRADFALLLYPLLAGAALVAARLVPATFPAGAAPGIGTALLWSLALAGPPCLAAGCAFAGLAPATGAGRAFAFESLGSAAAGSILALWLLGPLPDLGVAAVAVVAAAAAGALSPQRRVSLAALAVGIAVATALANPGLARWTLSAQGAWLTGAEERRSATSWLVFTRASGEPVLYADRVPVASGPDRAGAEELVHLPLALHPAPRAVVIIGIPPSGTMQELRRHGLDTVEAVVEEAGLLAALRADFPEWNDPGLRAEAVAARRFLADRPGRFDVILLVSPEPTSARGNRAFTAERFSAARRALKPGGIVAVALPGHAAAASLQTRRLHSSISRTLADAVGAPLALPAGRTLYVAGGSGLPSPQDAAAAISAELAARGIARTHLTPGTLIALLSPERMADAARWAALPEPPNHDLRPTTYRLALARTLAQGGGAGDAALLLLAAALVVGTLLAFGPRNRPVELAVAASGATGLGLQLALLLAYQVGTGALYRELGLLVAGYMAGAAAGAALGMRGDARRIVPGAALGQALVALALALVVPLLAGGGAAARLLAVAATALAGLLPGAQFAAAGRALAGSVSAGTLWAADLAGAACSSLLLLTFVVPVLGVRGAIVALGALQLASTALLVLPKPRPAVAVRPVRLLPSVPLLFAASVLLAGWGKTELAFQALAFGLPWRLAALLALAAALIASLGLPVAAASRARLQAALARLRAATRQAPVRLFSLAALLPVSTFPVARCYFAVPFLFCHACPRPCIFGWIRPWAVPVALVANLFDDRFCQRICPLGTVQSACLTLSSRPPRRLRRAGTLRLGVLAFTVAGYVAVSAGRADGVQGTGLYAALFRNAWTPSLAVLGVAALLLLASFRWRRPFCEALCPIGAASALIRRAEDRLPPSTEAPAVPGGDRAR